MNIKFLLIQLNEINFDLVDKYLFSSKKNKFINLKILKNTFKSFDTYSEQEYKNLEPWIQWVSVNLGKDFKQHKVYRLGDIVNHPQEEQIFEKIENRGFKVGAISPMKAANRLKNPSYFIPDPWTNTYSDDTDFSRRISLMLKQTVNDNAKGGLSLNSCFTILEIIFRTFHYKNTLNVLKYHCFKLKKFKNGKKIYNKASFRFKINYYKFEILKKKDLIKIFKIMILILFNPLISIQHFRKKFVLLFN